jgi:hypothetical protein
MVTFSGVQFIYFFLFLIVITVLLSYSKNDKLNSNTTWYNYLPNCPCQNPDSKAVYINDNWAKDKGNIAKYHKGARECFRSYPPITTSEGESAQQCCYDTSNNLITEGSGAGTPDKVSTCSNENEKGIMTIKIIAILGHYQKDVKPWNNMGGQENGWVKYNLLWKPNKGQNCKNNKVTK